MRGIIFVVLILMAVLLVQSSRLDKRIAAADQQISELDSQTKSEEKRTDEIKDLQDYMQSDEYKESILPKAVRARVAVEAAADFGWGKYVGLDGATVCMKSFGASMPGDAIFEKFGFTVENVAKAVKSVM